jgi:hypothetical protein
MKKVLPTCNISGVCRQTIHKKGGVQKTIPKVVRSTSLAPKPYKAVKMVWLTNNTSVMAVEKHKALPV